MPSTPTTRLLTGSKTGGYDETGRFIPYWNTLQNIISKFALRPIKALTMGASKEVAASIKGIQDGTAKNIESASRTAETITEATSLAQASGQPYTKASACQTWFHNRCRPSLRLPNTSPQRQMISSRAL